MEDRNSIAPRVIMGLIFGGITLFVAHLVLNPAPLSAALAFAGGALGFILMRTDTNAMVILFATVGAGVGIALHRNSHLAANSHTPAVPMLEHFAIQGLTGWGTALGALLVMGLVMRVMERR